MRALRHRLPRQACDPGGIGTIAHLLLTAPGRSPPPARPRARAPAPIPHHVTCALQAPGWRPSFTYYSPALSMFGALLCVAIMFLFNWLFALVSVIIGVIIFKYLEVHAPDKHWGPASEAQRYLRAVKAMGELSRVKVDAQGDTHVKAYRPQYLMLAKDSAQACKGLISLVSKFFKARVCAVRVPFASLRRVARPPASLTP